MAFENDAGNRMVSAANVGPRSGVEFVRPELEAMFADYDLIEHCLEGSRCVKDKGSIYLPMPEPLNKEPSNLQRYEDYKTRAVFYNVTQRTALGLLGQIFKRAPEVKTPTTLEQVVTDSDGSGISLTQLSRDASWLVLGWGRAGVFVDYPNSPQVATRQDLQKGNVRPTINVYSAKNVINWRTRVVGSKTILSLVVLRETYNDETDEFETKIGVQYRVLKLNESNQYSVQLWRASSVEGSDFAKYQDEYFPVGGSGQLLDAIPFTFIGSKNNEPSIDPSPLLDLANVNIAHYRNSADYEEMVFLVGQPMLVVSGLDSEWYKEILGGEIPFGSRSGLALPKDASADLLQVEDNSAAFEAMEHKERQMVALGAKIVQEQSVQRTATEAGNETAAEETTLVAIANNVSTAVKWALEWCAVFLNTSEKNIEYKLNTDFELARMSGDDVAKVIKSWQDGAISWTEMRSIIRNAGRTTLPDEEAKAEIKKAETEAIESAALSIGLNTEAENSAGPASADQL
ncbi:portal protein [Xanthomonas phage XAJ2]|uniref:Portal protein n=1 Tax=Xanthomonas phage XAJ2 TaxID=1775249 RepID=A0A1I9L2D6_9CAUD|nr:portal protein [Xanthomonas phage XAJ2]